MIIYNPLLIQMIKSLSVEVISLTASFYVRICLQRLLSVSFVWLKMGKVPSGVG